MFFKKSRDKPAGYAVLAISDQEWKQAERKQLDLTNFKGTGAWDMRLIVFFKWVDILSAR